MKIVDRKVLFAGAKFDFVSHTLETRSGERVERQFISHPGSVVLLPIFDDGRVILIRNFRHAVEQWVWELPAGTVEPHEPIDMTAARELTEETGYFAGRLEKLLEFYACPGANNEKMALFLATELEPGNTNLEDDEQIEVEIVPLKESLHMIQTGVIHDAKTMIGLWRASQLYPQWSE